MAYGDEQEQDFGMGGGGFVGIGPDTRAGPDNDPSLGYDASSQMADVLDAAADVVSGTAGQGGVSMGADYSGLMGGSADVGNQGADAGFELANQGLNQAQQASTDASNVTQAPMEVIESQLAGMSAQPTLQEMQSLLENAGITGMSTSPEETIASGGDVPMEGEDPVGLTPGEEVNQFITESQGGETVSEKLDQLNETALNLQAGTGFSTAAGQGGFTGGAQMYDMATDPTWAGPTVQRVGQPAFGVGAEQSLLERVQALRQQQQEENDALEARIAAQIAANEELDRLNALSVQASDVTQPLPAEFYEPDEWGMQNARTGWGQDVLGQQRMDPNARRNFEIQNPSPLMSEADYPAGDEWGMQDIGLGGPAIAETRLGAPLEATQVGLAEATIGPPLGSGTVEISVVENTPLSFEEANALYEVIEETDTSESVADKIEQVTKKSSKLTKAQKLANMEKVRTRWQERVAYAQVLRERYERALEKHGRMSRITADASRKYGRYVRSDEYINANSRLNPSIITGIATGGITKIGNMIQDYFHSLGKTDPRSPEQIAQDLLDGENSYSGESYQEGPGHETGTIEWMRSYYTWATDLPDNVLRNAIKYPDYLRLILDAVAAGEDIPLTVPESILNPSTGTGGGTGGGTGTGGTNFLNHPALQPQPSRWARPDWMT